MDTVKPYSPNTWVECFYAVTNEFVISSASMQGWRPTMEDSCSISVAPFQDPNCSIFGVFDGHGGPVISNFVSRNIHYYIFSDPAFKHGLIKHALSNAFVRLDNFLMNDTVYRKMQGGSTAVVVLIKNSSLYCANLGDSRAVAYAKGEVVELSHDHKPQAHDEIFRIIGAGCYVEHGRVNGDLSLSRAFGDFRYKKNKSKTQFEQAIIAVPDVMEFMITKNWEFVVLACDGIWDTMTNEEVCFFVKNKISNNIKVDSICEQLLHKCLCKEYPTAESVGTDNMTVIIVVFLDNIEKPYLRVISHDVRAKSINFFRP